MTYTKLVQVMDKYEEYLSNYRDAAPEPVEHIEHLYSMLPQMRTFLDEGRREKVMRWLGFMQGVFWFAGIYDLDELKGHNRPADTVTMVDIAVQDEEGNWHWKENPVRKLVADEMRQALENQLGGREYRRIEGWRLVEALLNTPSCKKLIAVQEVPPLSVSTGEMEEPDNVR